jgi:hypothetical protein
VSWASVHAFYHGDLDMLLLDGVRPLVAELRERALIDGFFFLRYWDGGPHLRIRLSAPADEPEVHRLALRRLREYLHVHPSTDLPEAARYPAEAARRAAEEGLTEYLREPMPNNTVHAIAYHPETNRYGTGAALSTVERHFVESSRIAVGLIDAGLTSDQRHTTAFSAILLTWHAERLRPPPPHPEHEARYLRTRASLHTLAGRMAEIVAGTSGLAPHGALTAWWRSIRTVSDRRAADLCAHLFCNRLGIGPREEQYLRYLAARTLTSEGGSR